MRLCVKKPPPADELVACIRELADALRVSAPIYLRPSTQGVLLETPSNYLEVIEKSVNREAEKLYGVETRGIIHRLTDSAELDAFAQPTPVDRMSYR